MRGAPLSPSPTARYAFSELSGTSRRAPELRSTRPCCSPVPSEQVDLLPGEPWSTGPVVRSVRGGHVASEPGGRAYRKT